MNKITIIGRLTADPVMASVADAVCVNFTVACDTRNKDGDGNQLTNFYRVSAWRKLGEVCSKYLHKGEKVGIVGDLLLREYVDKEGVKRSSLQVTATDVELLTPKNQSNEQKAPNTDATVESPKKEDTGEDELPF